MAQLTYHSKYGGLWLDRQDWEDELRRKAGLREIDAQDEAAIRGFVRDGYIILPQAAPENAVDAFRAEIERSFRDGNPRLRYQAHGSQMTQPLDRPIPPLGARVVDSFVALPQALILFAAPALLRFLTLIFGEPPLLFQSLSFDQGSQQGLHQDTAYVVVNRPLELAACWIALEDVREGSGELMYVPGSHRFHDFPFGGEKKHWDGDADPPGVHEAWSRFLIEESERRQLKRQTFLARKGDILIWHADLAHGGSPVTKPALTRRSLVGHFCPASARPRYFDHGPQRPAIRHFGGLAYASEHYDLAEGAEPAPGPVRKRGLMQRLRLKV